jgi:hypothetical protein
VKKIITLLAVVLGVVLLSAGACEDDADTVNHNITKAADNFEVQRRIVVFNGITDKYLLVIEGACSINDEGKQLEVLCKVSDGDGPDSYKKSFAGLSDNVSYFIEQGEPVEASAYHYRVTFKPQAIIPDVDFRGSSEDLPTEQP